MRPAANLPVVAQPTETAHQDSRREGWAKTCSSRDENLAGLGGLRSRDRREVRMEHGWPTGSSHNLRLRQRDHLEREPDPPSSIATAVRGVLRYRSLPDGNSLRSHRLAPLSSHPEKCSRAAQ